MDMPRLYGFGMTNIVARPTRDTAELSKEEQADGTPILEEKLRTYRPEVIVCVGKNIWEAICRHKYHRIQKKGEFQYGWQPDDKRLGAIEGEWDGAKIFVAASTSGLAASVSREEKERIYKELGDWMVDKRRQKMLQPQP